MSLDVSLTIPHCNHCNRSEEEVYTANITHNLSLMAKAANLYSACWHPEDIIFGSIINARDIIHPLEVGLNWLQHHQITAAKLNPENGWGNYNVLVEFIKEYLDACKKYPNATVSVSR